MKITHGAALLLSLAGSIHAWPASLFARQYSRSSIAKSISETIQKATGGVDPDIRAWDITKVPDLCALTFATHNGGGCEMRVMCSEGTTPYNDFQVCEVGKQQYWHNDQLGDFSIEYSQAGGINSDIDGLHAPILRFKGFNDWQPVDVNSLGQKNCDPNLGCDDAGDVCKEESRGTDKRWTCGMPKLGKASNIGNVPIGNDYEPGPEGYATGTCGIHIVQHQKDDPKVDPYSLEAWLKDANQDDIDSVYPAKPMGDGPLKVQGPLPEAVEIKTGAVDEDPVLVKYKGKEWEADMGGYDGGKREGDTNFACP